jgi:hypothetical protein
MKLASLGFLSLALACGGGAPPESETEEPPADTFASDDGDLMDRHQEVRQQQQQALEITAPIVADPEGAAVDEIEQAMNTLNLALLRGRRHAQSLRNAGEMEGVRALSKETRQANRDLLAAYEKLLASHPDPSPDILKQETQPDS